MSINNRIMANLWKIVNVDANNNPLSVKNVSAGSTNPTAATAIFPAIYINTTSGAVFYNATGAANAWTATVSVASNTVLGPATSVVNNVVAFDNTTGTLIKDTGKATPTGAFVGTTDTQTLTNKTIDGTNFTGATQFSGNAGNLGQVLTSGGSGQPPTWQTSSSATSYNRTTITATAGQTVLTATYMVGFAEVYVNGALLTPSEYTATNGTSITLGTALSAGDIVEVIAYNKVGIGMLAQGTAGALPYQTAPSTTGFVSIGSAGQVLTVVGGVPTWQAPATPPSTAQKFVAFSSTGGV